MLDPDAPTQQSISPRRTRQRTKQLQSLPQETPQPPIAQGSVNDGPPSARVDAINNAQPDVLAKLPDHPSAQLTRLRRDDHRLLLRKQDLLRKYDIEIPGDLLTQSAAVNATLVFAQEEAGTAVCVSPDGLLLTCSHCVAETEDDLDYERSHWLLFASGRIVTARCVAWDSRRDLALLKVVAAQDEILVSSSTSGHRGNAYDGDGSARAATRYTFPFVRLAGSSPPLNTKLVCIGHPGSEDLENDKPGVKTHYDVLHLSLGLFRGNAEGQDLQDNSEIGALMHDCWTYWGHSGAPILGRRSGRLIGLHSSWDDKTAMRRGVPLEAIRAFLESCPCFQESSEGN